MTDRPLGIEDLFALRTIGHIAPPYPDHWYYCRQHEQSHKVGEKCNPYPLDLDGGRFFDADEDPCIDIGPFMSEREANRCRSEDRGLFEPLGMEIER